MTVEEKAKQYILENWFDADDNVNAVVGGCDETMAMKAAVEALEKQIPKKPNTIHKIDHSGFHYNDCECDCGYSFWYIGQVKHCPSCGQAIEWSD